MTGEAQCEERKGTLAWHHIYTSFNPHRQCVKVTFYGLKSAIKTHSVWPSSHIFILKPNQSIWFATTSFYNIVISWYDCTKEENTLETGLLPLNSKFKLHIFNTSLLLCACKSKSSQYILRLGLNSYFSGEIKVVHHYLLHTPPLPISALHWATISANTLSS